MSDLDVLLCMCATSVLLNLVLILDYAHRRGFERGRAAERFEKDKP